MKPVKLSDLIEVLEFDSDEFGNWVDLQTGSVVRLAHSLRSAPSRKALRMPWRV